MQSDQGFAVERTRIAIRSACLACSFRSPAVSGGGRPAARRRRRSGQGTPPTACLAVRGLSSPSSSWSCASRTTSGNGADRWWNTRPADSDGQPRAHRSGQRRRRADPIAERLQQGPGERPGVTGGHRDQQVIAACQVRQHGRPVRPAKHADDRVGERGQGRFVQRGDDLGLGRGAVRARVLGGLAEERADPVAVGVDQRRAGSPRRRGRAGRASARSRKLSGNPVTGMPASARASRSLRSGRGDRRSQLSLGAARRLHPRMQSRAQIGRAARPRRLHLGPSRARLGRRGTGRRAWPGSARPARAGSRPGSRRRRRACSMLAERGGVAVAAASDRLDVAERQLRPQRRGDLPGRRLPACRRPRARAPRRR